MRHHSTQTEANNDSLFPQPVWVCVCGFDQDLDVYFTIILINKVQISGYEYTHFVKPSNYMNV